MAKTKDQNSTKNSRRGDTIIEVVLAISIFSIIAVSSVATMNSGLSYAQHSLELVMARNAINQQSEALRYIHNGVVSELEMPPESRQFTYLWRSIVDRSITASHAIFNSDARGQKFEINTRQSCAEAYSDQVTGSTYSFVINPRFVQPRGIATKNGTSGEDDFYVNSLLKEMIIYPDYKQKKTSHATENIMHIANVYPRLTYGFLSVGRIEDVNYGTYKDKDTDDQLGETNTGVVNGNGKRGVPIYRRLEAAEGVWVVPVRGKDEVRTTGTSRPKPEYYDFYIRTCWDGIGQRTQSTLTTIVRLYNPEVMESV